MKNILSFVLALFTFSLMAQTSIGPGLEKGDYMEFKIVNKNLKFISAYVEGPKKNGGKFSYGLNLTPFVKRKENWTVGTRLYAVNRKGEYKFLYEFTAADAGTVVNVTSKKD